MADDWDEDDFGTFESADATSTQHDLSSAMSNQGVTPAWLLSTQSPYESSTSKIDVNTADDIPKLEENVPPIATENNSNKPDVNTSSMNETGFSASGGDWNPFSSNVTAFTNTENIFSGDQTTSMFLPEKTFGPNNTVSNFHEKLEPKITKDVDVQVEAKENEQILDLKGKLDNALAVKTHTEETLKDLQQKLARSVEESKLAREAKELEHQTRIDELKVEYEKQTQLLKEESQKTLEMLTEKYISLSNDAITKLQNDRDKDMEEITEKCLNVLTTQSSTLTEKLSHDAESFNDTVSTMIDQCRKELKEFVQSETALVVEKCEKIKTEMAEHLKNEVSKEMEAQREIDLVCKRDAMDELSRNFKSQLEETLKLEREKNAIAIKTAVTEAQNTVRKALYREQK